MITPSLRDVFEAALDVAPDARGDWLAARCPDPVQRATIARMCDVADAAAESPSKIVDERFERLLEQVGDPRAALPAGASIGGFILQQVLGEGGASVVFRASREQDGVRQQVALKVLRRSLYTEAEQRRFRDERRALGQLQHPGIARLIEGGVSASGTPYIAMELVEGSTILDWVRARELDLAARLRLFVDVCRAVEAAHRALIVHRDLKPSNVLVTADGHVKLVDFGIAKLLDTDDDATRTHQHAMTPAYAAPEQFARGQITTATDVYSLGVMLAELITGQRREPGDARTPSSQVDDVTDPGVLPAPPARMRRALRGDLDNIVMQASADEPARRYASAGALADDIERYLAQRPVAAHPPSPWYRTRKFVARHRGGVLAGVALLLAVLAAAGTAVWQGGVARAQAERANTLRDFIVDAFAAAEPGSPRDGPPRIDEVVIDAIAKARADTDMPLEIRTELLSQLGRVLWSQGDIVHARETLQWNFEQAATAFGLRASLTLQAGHEFALALILGGDYPQARAVLDRLLADPPADEEADVALLYLASALLATREHQEGRALADAALGTRLARRSGDDGVVARALEESGNVQLAADDVEGALATYRELLAAREKRSGPEHVDVAAVHAALSRAYRRSGDLDAAERHIRTALAIQDAVLPPVHWRRANGFNALLFVLMQKRDFVGALAAAEDGLRINRAVAGDENPEVANDLNSVGMMRMMSGDATGALEPLRESLRLSVKLFGPDHHESAVAHANLGTAIARAGQPDEGETELRRALDIFAADPEPDPHQFPATWEKLARVQLDRGNIVDATETIERIEALLADWQAPTAFWDGRVAVLRATVLLQQGDAAAARNWLERAQAQLAASSNADAELSAEVPLLRALAARALDAADAAAQRDVAERAYVALRNPPPRIDRLHAALRSAERQ